MTNSLPTPSASAEHPASPVARSRVDWVDAAKGIAIMLVALAHAVQWTTLSGMAPEWWNTLNLALIVFRMPLFFLASGLFASSIIARSWPRLWRSRLSLLFWALLLWTVIRYLYFLVFPNPTPIDELSVIDLVLAPVRPSNGLWFLYALGLFFVATKLMRGRVDWRIQLAGAALLSIAFFARADTGNIAWNGMGRYFVFFIAGCYLRDPIMSFVERRGLPTAAWLATGFVATTAAIFALNSRFPPLTGLLIVSSALALGAGLLIARFVSGVRALRWITFIGRNTLPVYVVHVLFVSAITSLLLLGDGQPWLERLAPVLPLLVATGAIALSLGLWRLIRDLPVLRYAYSAPRWFSGRDSTTGTR